jgi:hypothetical protein
MRNVRMIQTVVMSPVQAFGHGPDVSANDDTQLGFRASSRDRPCGGHGGILCGLKSIEERLLAGASQSFPRRRAVPTSAGFDLGTSHNRTVYEKRHGRTGYGYADVGRTD